MTKKRKKKILFGAVDIGFRINHYTRYIAENFGDQLIAESFSKYKLPESHYATEYTYLCEIQKRSKLFVYWYTSFFFLRALFRYQVFHFFSGETILPWKLRGFELRCYQMFGKKVIMHFVGSDIRSEKYLQEKNDHLQEYIEGKYSIQNPISEPIQHQLIDQAQKYADHIIVSTPDLIQLIPQATFIPVFLDTGNLPATESNRSAAPIRIIHSPSAYNTKGSEYIHKALDAIQQEFGERVEIITPGKKLNEGEHYSLSRYELLAEFQSAHVVIDQLLIGWYGLKSVEALYYGCEVVCYIEPALEGLLQENKVPITNANAVNIADKLSDLIDRLLSSSDSEQHQKELMNFTLTFHNMHTYHPFFSGIWLN